MTVASAVAASLCEAYEFMSAKRIQRVSQRRGYNGNEHE
jgi:hypothetical protein